MSTTLCPHCGSELATEGLPADATLVCAGCMKIALVPQAKDLRRVSRLAIASLALAALTPFLSCLAGLPALLLGIAALVDLRKQEEQLKGRGLAIAGIALAVIGSLICTPIVIAIVLPAVQSVRHEGTIERTPSPSE